MSEYNRHKWAMEWMHGGGRDPNGRGLDEEIKIGKEDWLKSQQVAQDERIGFESGQLVQPGPGRQGYAGDDFITFPLKKYSDAILDKPIRLDPTKAGVTAGGTPSKTLREIFEVVGRTQGGQDMIDKFKKNPTEDLFVRLRKRRKFRLRFEEEQKLPPAEKVRLRKRQLEAEKKWRVSEKGKAYRAKFLAEQGIFPAGTSEEKVWRDIYNASKKKLTGSGTGRFEEVSRFKIKLPKHIKIDPKTGLPKAVKSASGKMYVPWEKYYKDIYFYDTVTKKNIKFGEVEKWMTDNLPKGAKKYKNAIENYDIKLAIEELPVKYKGRETSLANVYKQKIANPKFQFAATPVNVNHAGLSRDEFWKTEVTTSSGNNKINAILQEKSSRYKLADTKVAKNKIMKEAATEVNKIAGGATGIFQKKKVGIEPTPKKVIKTIAQELRFGKKKVTGLLKNWTRETPEGRLQLKKQNTSQVLNKFLTKNKIEICKTELKTGKSVLCGSDFAKAEPGEFIKEVRKREDAVNLLTKGNKFKNALRGLSVWAKGELGPFGWIGSMATIDAGLTLAAKAEGKDWLEALDEGVLWFLPRQVLKSEERALMSRAEGLSDQQKESMRIYFKLEDIDTKWAENEMNLEYGEEEGPVTVTTPWGDTLEEEGTGVSIQQSYESIREHLARANNKLITDLKRNEDTRDTDKVLQETYKNVWDTRGRRALDLINESKDTYLDILAAQSGETGLGRTSKVDPFGEPAGVLTSAFSNPLAYLRATTNIPGLRMSREEKEKIATDAGREDLLYKEYVHPLYGPGLSFEQWKKVYPEKFGGAEGGIASLLKK